MGAKHTRGRDPHAHREQNDVCPLYDLERAGRIGSDPAPERAAQHQWLDDEEERQHLIAAE